MDKKYVFKIVGSGTFVDIRYELYMFTKLVSGTQISEAIRINGKYERVTPTITFIVNAIE